MTPYRIVCWAKRLATFAFAASFAFLPNLAKAQAPVFGDTYVQSGKNAGIALGAGGTGRNLLIDANTKAISFIQFDLSRLPATAVSSNVSRATLRLFVNSVSTAGAFDVFLVTSPWNELTATYNSQPSLGPVAVSGVQVPLSMNSGGYLEIDVTSLVQLWLSAPTGGGAANYGIALVPSSGSGISAQFDSKESTSTSHDAEIEIDYVDSTVTSAIANLQSQLTNASNASQNGDTSLLNAINSEVSRSELEETSISASVNTETLRAESAEATISSGSTAALAQKANLSGGNNFTGDQVIAGNLNSNGNIAGNTANFQGNVTAGTANFQGQGTVLSAVANNTSGWAAAVEGITSSPNGSGIHGVVNFGSPNPNGGTAISGEATATSGWATAIHGIANSPQATAVVAENNGGGTSALVRANDPNATLLSGVNTYNNGFQQVFRLDAQGNITTNGTITASGTVSAQSFSGDGSGLTNVGAAANATYATNAGHANVADSSTSAGTATTALNTASLGGVPASGFAQLTQANSFSANQTVNGNIIVAGSGNGILFPDGTEQTSAASGAGPTLFYAPPKSSSSIELGSAAANNYTVVATLNLPAGSYWIFGSVTLVNSSTAGEVEGVCHLSGVGINSDLAVTETDFETENSQVGSWSATLPIQTVVTLTAPTTVTMQCGGGGTGYSAATFLAYRPALTSLQVGTVNAQ